jgi:hypothetical protein
MGSFAPSDDQGFGGPRRSATPFRYIQFPISPEPRQPAAKDYCPWPPCRLM